jgi:hypothetical protein
MTQKASHKVPLKVNLEEETYEEIAQRAEQKGLSKSGIARSILRTQLRG